MKVLYYPGETNLRRAQVLIVNKLDSAPVTGVQEVLRNIEHLNPSATVIQARSAVSVDQPDLIRGKRVLVIEDESNTDPWRNGVRFGSYRRSALWRGRDYRSTSTRARQSQRNVSPYPWTPRRYRLWVTLTSSSTI